MAHKNPFSYDTLQDMTGFLFWQNAHLWSTSQEKMLKRLFGISQLQYVILASTYWLTIHGVEVTQSYLSAHTKVEKMTISKNIVELQRQKYIDRNRHSMDKRANLITISERGKKLLDGAIIEIEKMDNTFFNILKRRRTLLNSLLLQMLEENSKFFL